METITLKAFFHLIILGSLNVTVVKSKNPFVSFEKGLADIKILQNGDTLNLSNNSKTPVSLTIGTKYISSFNANGNASVTFTKDCINFNSFSCKATNDCNISVVNNYSNSFSLQLENNSKFYGEQFPVLKATIVINGSGLANINCNEELTSTINGSGSISNSGKAKKSETKSFSNHNY